MNEELVKQLVRLFLNWPEDELNLIDWKWEANILWFRVEAEDGMIEIYTIDCQSQGYAARLNGFAVQTV